MLLTLLPVVGMILLYLVLYYAAGSLVLKLVPGAISSVPFRFILGFFVYFFLFTAVTLPLKMTLQPLSLLSAVWGVILILLAAAFLLTGIPHVKASLASLRVFLSGRGKYVLAALLALILLQVFWFNLNDETYAIWDQSYYLGDTATSLYTNTISQYNPYTGRILDFLNTEYLLETYQNHGSVMCQIFSLHPMVENMTVMASVVIILYQLVFYEIGMLLFHNNRCKSILLVFFLFLLNVFSFNLYTAAEFLMIRPSEGKTILAVLILPTLFYLFLCAAQKPGPHRYWLYTLLVILGSFGLNMSSIFMIPFEISALYLPLCLKRKSIRVFGQYLLFLAPCLFFSVLYIITKNYWIIYTGR